MIIDMELPSFPPTRAASPPLADIKENGAPARLENGRGRSPTSARKPDPTSPVMSTGFGNLMKTAKKDVVVPEFDMSNFF